MECQYLHHATGRKVGVTAPLAPLAPVCLAYRFIPFLFMLPIFRDRKAGMANRTVLTIYWKQFLFGIPFSLECMIAISYPQPRQEVSYAAEYLSVHEQFLQQKICLKAQKFHHAEQQLPHNSLFSLCSIYVKKLANFIIDSSPCQFYIAIPLFSATMLVKSCRTWFN